MKKLISVILAAITVLSVVACNNENTKTTTSDPTKDVTETKTIDNTASERIEKIKNVAIDYAYAGEISFMELINDMPPVFPTIGQHPRVMFTADDIQTLRANMKDPSAATEYSKYAELRDNTVYTDRALAGETVGCDLSVIEAKAFAYAVEGDALKGYEALMLIEKAFTELEYLNKDEIDVEDYTRSRGRYIYAAAQVYDWCYDLLGDKDKAMLYAAVQNLCAPYMEIGFPPAAKSQSTISSHSSEAQLLKEWLSFAIAIYDEYPNAYDYVAGRLYAEYVPFRNYYYQSNFYHQGTSYGTYRFGFDLMSDKLIYTITGKHLYDENIQNVVTSFAYCIRADGNLIRMGDDGKQQRFLGLSDCALMTAGMYKNGYAQSVAREYYYYDCSDGHNLSSVEFLIFNDPTVEELPLETLPLVSYNGTPLGQMIARTGWERKNVTSDDIIVLMKIGETYVTNHDHYDSGSFQIYYKGSLAIDSGSENSSSYMKRTVAHNALLVFRERDLTDKNYGGQHTFDSECQTWGEWKKDKFRKPNSVTAHDSLESDGKLEYAYIAGKIAAYPKAAVTEYYRHMMFVPTDDENTPGLFFVFDNVTSKKPEYIKSFLLHMREEPTVNEEDRTVTIRRTYGDYNGKLVNQTLLPKNVSYEIIGGDGKSEWLVDENYGPDNVNIEELKDSGWGRVEIRTSGEATSYLLNVMTIGDADDSAESPKAELFENGACAAAKIMNKIVVFTKSSDRTATDFEIETSGDGEYDYIVANVAAGEWTVTVGGTTLTLTATEDGGTLHFKAPTGLMSFKITK